MLKVSFALEIFTYLLQLLGYVEKQPNPLTTIILHHIEISQLICIANQLTSFSIMGGEHLHMTSGNCQKSQETNATAQWNFVS